MFSDVVYALFLVLSALNIIFAAVIVFFERKNPAATWAWLMVSMLLPYVGFILYICLGLDANKHKSFIKKSAEDEKVFKKFPHDDISLNGLEIFHDGNHKFKALIDDIEKAEKFIHLQYYIIRKDNLSGEIISALCRAVCRGVEVRILADGMGTFLAGKNIFKPLVLKGGKAAVFMPPHFVRINYRNHRKIAVIDGKTGYLGGMNIGDEYLGKRKRFGFWRDCHLRIQGQAVDTLEARFITDWNYSSTEQIEPEKYLQIQEQKGTVKIQILTSGPDSKWPAIYDGFIKLVMGAKKSLYIQTPYFVPDETLFQALRIAALSGVDVRIMIPAKPDHPFVYWAALSYLGELITAGVKCYQYKKGFLHSKVIMADSEVSTVGSANIDVRSFRLNFEINAFIYDKAKTAALEKQFMEDIADSTPIDMEFYQGLSAIDKIRESVSRLLSPLL